MELEKLIEDKKNLERIIEERINEFQEKYGIDVNIAVYENGRLMGNNYDIKKVAVKVQL